MICWLEILLPKVARLEMLVELISALSTAVFARPFLISLYCNVSAYRFINYSLAIKCQSWVQFETFSNFGLHGTKLSAMYVRSEPLQMSLSLYGSRKNNGQSRLSIVRFLNSVVLVMIVIRRMF